jgi:glucokinase
MSLLGIDIGGTNVRVALVEAGRIIHTDKHPRADRPEALLAQLGAIRDGHERDGVLIEAAGVGCAGLIRSDGSIATSANLPGFEGFPLASSLADTLAIPVTVENDATAALWAEMRAGVATGHKDVLFVALGTGIGGGLAFEGRIQRGGLGFAGEIGHMTVLHDGPMCPCGRRGCWEEFGSGRALGRFAREAAAAGQAERMLVSAGGSVADVVGEHVTLALNNGDPDAQPILDRLGYWVGLGIGSLVTILDPELVIVGGGLAAIGDPLLAVIEAGLVETLVDYDLRGGVRLRLVEHHTDGGAFGAALLAADLL